MSDPINVINREIISPDKLIIPDPYKSDLEGVLISSGEIKSRVSKLASEISKAHYPEEILALCVLDGAMKFYADLLYNEHMWTPFEIRTFSGKSYKGTTSTGEVNLEIFDFSVVKGRKVLVVEDIIDTGHLLKKITNEIYRHKPFSLEIVCLLDKPERRDPEIDIVPEYCGFTIPNEFVVGYGLDYNNKYRGLRHICVLKKELTKP